jgi:hypothetical protein
VRVAEAELRQRLFRGDYLRRAEDGEFGCCLTDANPSRSRDEPNGTRSVLVSFLDKSFHRGFMVHFYLRPDGTIGGSGKPDPKWLFEDGVIYVATK